MKRPGSHLHYRYARIIRVSVDENEARVAKIRFLYLDLRLVQPNLAFRRTGLRSPRSTENSRIETLVSEVFEEIIDTFGRDEMGTGELLKH